MSKPDHAGKPDKDKDKDKGTGTGTQERLDYFAGLAMQAWINFNGAYLVSGNAPGLSPQDIARKALQQAEAMIAELDKSTVGAVD